MSVLILNVDTLQGNLHVIYIYGTWLVLTICYVIYGSDSCNLRVHERTHTGLKPFACRVPGCTYTSAQSNNLKTHMKRYHNDDEDIQRVTESEYHATAEYKNGLPDDDGELSPTNKKPKYHMENKKFKKEWRHRNNDRDSIKEEVTFGKAKAVLKNGTTKTYTKGPRVDRDLDSIPTTVAELQSIYNKLIKKRAAGNDDTLTTETLDV